MKKRIIAVAVLTMCFAISTGSTLAFFTSEDEVHNVITSDAVDITIEEWQKTDEGLLPYPKDEVEIMPGDTVSKIVNVRNNEAESYIRAYFDVVVTDANRKPMDLSEEERSKVVKVVVNRADWQQKDGEPDWWYYADSVDTNAVTTPLFTEVAFDGPNMTNEYQNCRVEINVYAQAVQSANNGNSALEAAGWPEK